MRIAVALGILVVAGAAPALAQGACPESPDLIAGLEVYRGCQVDAMVRPDLDSARLREIAASGCADETFRLVVSAAGEVRQVVVGQSSHAVRRGCDSLATRWRFTPARRGGREVAARLTTTLRFEPPLPQDLLWDPTVQWRGTDGRYELSIRWAAAPEGAYDELAPASRDSAFAAVLDVVAREGTFAAVNHYCVDVMPAGGRPDRVVTLLAPTEQAVFPRDRCPSIGLQADGRVVYRDDLPYLHVGIRGRSRLAGPGAIVVDAWYARGLGGAGFRCRAERVGAAWRARCVTMWTA